MENKICTKMKFLGLGKFSITGEIFSTNKFPQYWEEMKPYRPVCIVQDKVKMSGRSKCLECQNVRKIKIVGRSKFIESQMSGRLKFQQIIFTEFLVRIIT